MHWETPEKEQLRFGKKRGKTELSRKQLCHENSKYNPVLIKIVKLCLHFDPVKRPSPGSLLRGVQKHMKDAVAGVENYQSVEGVEAPQEEGRQIQDWQTVRLGFALGICRVNFTDIFRG